MNQDISKVKSLVEESNTIVIIQADNPDADSLGSSLALEHILGDMNKTIHMYCGVDMPGYLKYMKGWDRVRQDLPNNFDLSIIVDASTMTLLDKLVQSGYQGKLSSKPCIVLDHHATVDNEVPFASVIINDSTKSSAGELIYTISSGLKWTMSVEAQEQIMTSILGDTQGLSNQLATPETYRVMASMVEDGVNRPQLEELRREYSKMPTEIFRYKGDLIRKTEFYHNDTIATATIPQGEITKFSPLYNPAPLIQTDMLQTSGVLVAIVFKNYADGKVTAAIRCNANAPIGGKLAEYMGGGGHDFASGFKIDNGSSFESIKQKCLEYAANLIDESNN